MNRLIGIIEKISDWMAYSAAIILALITLIILVEIFLWNVFEATTLIADEYSAYGLATIIFWGAGFCLKEKGHIRINLVLNFLPDKLSRRITFVSTAIATLFVSYLCFYLFRMTAAAYRYQSTSGTLTNTPLWIPQAVMLAGALFFCLQFLASTFRTYQAIGGGDEVF
jgi:TRAP-type C4-dicarboxylate transport system permease small subunit